MFASYVIDPAATAAATPTFDVPAGTYTSTQTVSLHDATAGSLIHYTTDGSTPTTSSSIYTGPISVSKSQTIQAIAFAPSYVQSSIASATYTINLPPPTPNFTVGANPSALTVTHGTTGSLTLTVTPQNGFNSTVSFSCSGLPSGVTCSFSPSTITPSGTTASSVQLAITAPLQTASTPHSRPSLLPSGTVLTLAGLFGVLIRKRRRMFLALLCLSAVSILLTGCSGGGSTNNGGETPPTKVSSTSTITVTATSSTVQQTTSVILTLN